MTLLKEISGKNYRLWNIFVNTAKVRFVRLFHGILYISRSSIFPVELVDYSEERFTRNDLNIFSAREISKLSNFDRY